MGSIFSGVNNPGLDFTQFSELELEALLQIAQLIPPGADRILFWDESAQSYAYLEAGTGLTITGTVLTATGSFDGAGVANEITYWVDSDTLGSLATATYPSLTELSYVKGVTSAIQTQLNARQPLDSDLTTIAGLTATSDNFMQAKAGAWASRTIAQVKTDLSLSGTNSGDQTSIVGITGTKAEFDTAVTDGNFLYVGDITQYTDELAQDATGAMVTDGSLVYVDATPLLTRGALTGAITASQGSNTTSLGSFTKAELDTAVSDGNVLYVGDVTQYTDEMAQDAVGAMVDATIVYVDGTPLLTRAALTGDITAPQASNATTLATVNANVGSFGSATQVATFTVNAKGLTTAAANATIAIPSTAVTDFTEAVQDVAGAFATDSSRIDFTYDDTANTLTADVKTDSIDNTFLANMAQSTIKGRAAAAGTGDPTDLSAAQVATIINASLDHGTLTGLTDDDHTQYALLAGRAGSQTLIGGTGSAESLTFSSTAHATKGLIKFGSGTQIMTYDQTTGYLGIGDASPDFPFEIALDTTNVALFNISGTETVTLNSRNFIDFTGTMTLSFDGTSIGVNAAVNFNPTTGIHPTAITSFNNALNIGGAETVTIDLVRGQFLRTSFRDSSVATITDNVLLDLDDTLDSSTATPVVTNHFGARLDVFDFAANNAGIVIAQPNGSGNNSGLVLGQFTIPTGDWAIYSSSTYDSYIADDLAIGTSTPVGRLTVRGTGTASGIILDAQSSGGIRRMSLLNNGDTDHYLQGTGLFDVNVANTITHDATSSGVTTTAQNTVTASHTTGNFSNRIMVVGISMRLSAGTETITSVTYGAQSLTLLETSQTTNAREEVWYLIAPNVTTDTVTATVAASATDRMVMGVSTYYNVNQTTPFGATAEASGNSTTASVTVTSAVGDLVVDFLAKNNSADAITADGSQTSRWATVSVAGGDSAGSRVYGGGSSEAGGDGTTVMSWTWPTNNRRWTTIGVALRPTFAVGLEVTTDGRVYGSALHNNAGSVTGTTTQYIASGTYTPTLTNVANLDASTAYAAQWMRVGNVVSVSGKVDIDPTLTATSTQLGMSLPIASDFTTAQQCGGTAFSSGIAAQGAAILGDTTNNRAQLQYIAGDVTNQAMYFTFQYVVV